MVRFVLCSIIAFMVAAASFAESAIFTAFIPHAVYMLRLCDLGLMQPSDYVIQISLALFVLTSIVLIFAATLLGVRALWQIVRDET